MSTETKHTPTPVPWECRNWGETIEIRNNEIAGIAFINPGNSAGGIPSKGDLANAKFIIRAVNSHAKLVEVLSAMLRRFGCECCDIDVDHTCLFCRAKEALSLAQGSENPNAAVQQVAPKGRWT